MLNVLLASSRIAVLASALLLTYVAPAGAAEATSGAIVGTVSRETGAPLGGAHVAAAAPQGRYVATSGSDGRFTIVGAVPGTYSVSVEASGYQTEVRSQIVVTAGANVRLDVRLAPVLATIGRTRAANEAFAPASTADTFTISGPAARADAPVANASGLASYTAGTVQGAVAAVPGIALDTFANVLARGGKVADTVFEYDSVPLPQGLIAEPGGNVAGAQLRTTGIASTSATLGGYSTQAENALGGIVDQYPAVGTFPARVSLELSDGIGSLHQTAAMLGQWATPDLRWRYAVAANAGSEYFSYGDGRSFYPAEAATYGLALQSRGGWSASANVHFAPSASDDVAASILAGATSYQQYGSPYAGETVGAFDGSATVFPGERTPNAPVAFASGITGTFDILKLQWLHSAAHATSRVQLYRSQFGSVAGGPFWDDLSFPDGVISLAARQGGRETGLTIDVDTLGSAQHEVKYGAAYRVNTSFLDQVVPTADEVITSHPTLFSYLVYLGDTWSVSRRFDLSVTARLSGTHIMPSDGAAYDVAALDPHLAAVYRIGSGLALRATYDRTTVAPKPLEADRTDSANPAPFVPLASEIGHDLTYALERTGRTAFRFTYYAKNESNRIDVLPFNFRSAIAAGGSPTGVGVPTNVGALRAHGVDLWIKHGGLTFDVNAIRGFSSSASQFAYNGLNAAAVAAGQLFPLAYVPDVSASVSYEFAAGQRHIRITPALSFRTGYPYGNGTSVWVFDPVTKRPVNVPNDNFVNPGSNYYFLQNPAIPHDVASNPYIGSLGTPEGSGSNSLRGPSQTLVSVHAEADVSARLTAVLDVSNLLGVTTPTALQSNPYLIGPPGYTGGNPVYGAAYAAKAGFAQPYALGNGVPTNDGVSPAVPWNYGTAGYVPQGYPLARTVWFGLRYRL